MRRDAAAGAPLHAKRRAPCVVSCRAMRRPLLVLAVALGLLLRAWNLDFGLDFHDPARAIFHHQQDEEGMVRALNEGLLRGELHPGLFMLWGTAGYWLFGAVDAVVLWPLSWSHEGGWTGLLDALLLNPSWLHLSHRLASLLCSLGLLVFAVRIARRTGGERAADLTLVLLSLCYLHVREAHFGVLDMLTALCVTAAVSASLALAETPSARRYALAGLWTGLAAASKYFGGAVALCVVAAHLSARVPPPGDPGGRRPPFARLALAGLVALAAFLAVSPHVLYAPGELLDKLVFQQQTIAAKADAGSVFAVLGHHLLWSLGTGLGEGAALLALLGVAWAWRAGGRPRLLVVCLLLLFAMFFVARSRAVRYGIAHVALLSVLAACAIDRIAAAASRPRLALAALLALALLPSLARAVAFDRALGGRDTRLDVLEHLAAAGAGPNDTIAVGLYGLPRPSMLGGTQAMGGTPYLDYMRATTMTRWLSRAEGRQLRPRFLLRDGMFGFLDAFGWDDFAQVAATEYRVVLDVDGRVAPGACELPDKIAGTPSFLLPYANPWAMTRPGPPMTLYERIVE